MHSLDELTRAVESDLAELIFPASPEGLYAPMYYTLEGGGKRIRPVLTLMSCELFGGSMAPARPVALAVEVFHNFTLLHDDIMDRSDTRRGRPAVHKKWDERTAILSGDQMLIWAYKLLESYEDPLFGRLTRVFTRTAAEVCEGQQYDMDFEARDDVSVAEYLDMIRLKTAVLLGGALALGALCGGADERRASLTERFGIGIGMAFQLQDDLLDTYGDPAMLGKPVGGDILAGKKNFLLATALERADGTTRGELLSLLHDAAMPAAEKITAVKTIYDTLELRAVAEARAKEYYAEALQALDALKLPAEKTEPLRELAHSLLDRQK